MDLCSFHLTKEIVKWFCRRFVQDSILAYMHFRISLLQFKAWKDREREHSLNTLFPPKHSSSVHSIHKLARQAKIFFSGLLR